MHLPTYLVMLSSAERTLSASYSLVADGHADEHDLYYFCQGFARQCVDHAAALEPILTLYEERRQPEPDRLHPPGLTATRDGMVGLLRDLQDLYQIAGVVDITWTLVGQAAAGARDRLLRDVIARCHPQITEQQAWLRMRMQGAAPQVLLVGP